jgi:acyl-coenzyme A synthetase/AMP-(fatty) acid ligase
METLGLQIDVIRAVEGGRLPRTSSGKLMRQMIAAQYREGSL